MARKGDTPEYVNKMQQEVFEVLAEAKSLEDLRQIKPKAREVYRRYLDELDGADVKELAIHRRVSRLNYSRRCAEASAVQAQREESLPWLLLVNAFLETTSIGLIGIMHLLETKKISQDRQHLILIIDAPYLM